MPSTILPGEIVIDDSTPDHKVMPPPNVGRGLHLALRGNADDYAYGDTAPPFPDELLIDESEWQARIEEMEERKTRISDLIALAGLPCKNQQQTEYCWCNAPTHCNEITRMLQNEPVVILSPASVGAQITGYQNTGGWGQQALAWIIANGQNPVSSWPANAISRQYHTAANTALALNYRVSKWYEIKPRNLQQQMSALLRRMPLAMGLNWWSHEITGADPVWVNGKPGVRIRNSWGMDWPTAGAGGYSILQGSKMLPDDAVTPLVTAAN